MSTTYLLERAWLGDGPVLDDVEATVEDGVFIDVRTPREPPGRGRRGAGEDRVRLGGLTIPGLANCHSHAFHRALRGRTQAGRGTFWTWREQMYDVAARLTPDDYYALARATYREMALSGITSVGEFHYLHHGPDGTPYDEPNAMGAALVEAASDAGVRIALLDTCYLTAGIDRPAAGVRLRFSDGHVGAWARRAESLRTLTAGRPDVVVGAGIHSVRAVPRGAVGEVADWARRHRVPLHVHLSEQPAENDACFAAYGVSPTQVLAGAGALEERTSVVHATHLDARDVTTLGAAGARACFCPTTERDLGDGIGPSRRLHEAGSPLTLGSDSQAVIDPFEEMRAVELDERLATRQRGHWSATELLRAATANGHDSLGFVTVGRIATGYEADLVTLDTGTPRTAGTGAGAETAVFAATAADVVHVLARGRRVAGCGDGAQVARELARAVAAVWEQR